MKSVLLLVLMFTGIASHADQWIARLSCNGGEFVLDGRHTFEAGFMDHQAVIRGAAVAHFQKYVDTKVALSPAGEIIVQGIPVQANKSFETEWMLVPLHVGQVVYQLHGRPLDGNRFRVSVTSFACTPGTCGPPPGAEMTNYIFNDCQVLN